MSHWDCVSHVRVEFVCDRQPGPPANEPHTETRKQHKPMTIPAEPGTSAASRCEQSTPHMPCPAAPWPYFANEEIEAAVKVLRSGRANYWTREEAKLFEKEFAEFTTRKHPIALANGTVAL